MARKRKTPKSTRASINVPGASYVVTTAIDTTFASLPTDKTTQSHPDKPKSGGTGTTLSTSKSRFSKTISNDTITRFNDGVLDRPTDIATMLKTPPTFEGTIGILPPEVRTVVFQNLCWSASIHLGATNNFYRSFVARLQYSRSRDKMPFLQAQEEKPRFDGSQGRVEWFACAGCCRLKPQKRFEMLQIRVFFPKYSEEPYRRCLDCRTMRNRYTPGMWIVNGNGKSMRFCKSCEALRSGYFCGNCNRCGKCSGTCDSRCSHCETVLTPPMEEAWETPQWTAEDIIWYQSPEAAHLSLPVYGASVPCYLWGCGFE